MLNKMVEYITDALWKARNGNFYSYKQIEVLVSDSLINYYNKENIKYDIKDIEEKTKIIGECLWNESSSIMCNKKGTFVALDKLFIRKILSQIEFKKEVKFFNNWLLERFLK